MLLLIGRLSCPVLDLAAASARYQRFRGTKPADHVPEGLVRDDGGTLLARVSYNGPVWPAEPWHVGQRPILEAVDEPRVQRPGS